MELEDVDAAYKPYQAKQKCNSLPRKSTVRHLQFFEVFILTPVILVIIGLFCIPTILFAVSQSSEAEGTNFNTPNSSACLEVEAYTGGVCRDTFTSLQLCFSGMTSPPPALNIPSLVDQQTGERDAMRLVNGLSFLNPSLQCRESILPFLCLSIFTLCDSSNRLHTILRDDCLELRENVCAEEWSEAVGLLNAGILPVCEDLLDTTEECTGNNSSLAPPSTNQIDIISSHPDNQTTPSPEDAIICSQGFFFDENVTNLCRPICGEFNPLPLASLILYKIFLIVGCIAAVVVLTLALAVQRKKLLVIPLIFFIYMCTSGLLLFAVVIVGLFINPALFCGSKDFIVATEKENDTPFCIISGLVATYALSQVCIWGTLFSVFLYWGVAYPFSFRQLRTSGRIRYAHIISVILTVVVPLPSALIHLKGGLVVIMSPPIVCFGRNTDYSFYTFVLPLSVTLAIMSCFFVLTFWTILKEFVVKKLLARKKLVNVGKGELKIAVVIAYCIMVGVMSLVVYIRAQLGRADTQINYEEYLLCESRGNSADCMLSRPYTGILTVVANIMLSFLPVLVLVVICDLRVFKKKSRRTLPSKTSTTNLIH